MTTTIRVIFLCIATTVSSIDCMEKSRSEYNDTSLTAKILLDNNGLQLKQLLAFEARGRFIPDLSVAEQTLTLFLSDYNKEALNTFYDKETLKLATLVSQRPQHTNELLTILNDNNKDNPDELEKIITRNPYIINAYTSQQTTPLHEAVLLEKKNCIKKLLKLNANPNCVDEYGYSPLHMAILGEKANVIVEYLLLYGANPDMRNHQGDTPFGIACDKISPALEEFEKYGYLFFSSLWPYKNPYNLLKNNGYCLKELAKQPIGSSDWKLAATTLNKLLNHIEGNKKKTPITSELLINRNNFTLINVYSETCDELFGKTTMDYARGIIIKKEVIKSCLLSLVQENNGKKLKTILNNHTISAPLQYKIVKNCIATNSADCLSICLNYGFNPNRYHRQLSPLHYAVECNNPQAITLLAVFNPDLVPLNNKNQTPLDYAIILNNTECVNAMVGAIRYRLVSLHSNREQCSLVKHIFNNKPSSLLSKKSWFCEECISELSQQLCWHNL